MENNNSSLGKSVGSVIQFSLTNHHIISMANFVFVNIKERHNPEWPSSCIRCGHFTVKKFFLLLNCGLSCLWVLKANI